MRARLILCLWVAICWPRSASAESSDLNLHIDLAYAQPIIGPLAGGDGVVDNEDRRGMAGWASLEWKFDDPWGAEAVLGLGYLWETSDLTTQIGQTYTNFALGLRYRFVDDREGYANQSWGNWWGNGWAAVHLGYQHLDGVQLGFDLAVGYEFSVFNPVQLGVFAKWQVGFGGRRAGADSIIFLGLTGSMELLGKAAPLDRDGDGLSDEQEQRLGTDPFDADTDSDGIRDQVEVETKTDPLRVDTDNDGLSDGIEDRNRNGRLDPGETDPRETDTDKGGIGDVDETKISGMDPQDPKDDDADGDGVADPYDSCKDTPSKTEVNDAGCATLGDGGFELSGVAFRSGSSKLESESDTALQKALLVLKDNPSVRVEIGGHTDNQGSRRRNKRLSQRRANAVRTWLVRHGIKRYRMKTRGYGQSKPKVPNVDDESRASNRRIEFKVLD